MTMREAVITKLSNLPDPLLRQVSDFIDLISQEPTDLKSNPIHEERVAEVEKILKKAKGSWGNLSLDEIDARLAEQRRFNWGK
jgi:hypothetical protein